MSMEQYRLFVLAGPDRGRLINMSAFPIMVGRGSGCNIKLNDRYISREHFALLLTDDGIVMRIVSSSGARIGSRRRKYRKGKQLILEGGDTVFIGGETEIVLLAPGDPVPELDSQEAATETAVTADVDQNLHQSSDGEDSQVGHQASQTASDSTLTLMTSSSVPSAKKKSRKIWMFLSIYILGIVAVGVVFTVMGDSKDQSISAMPDVFTEEQLYQIIIREEVLDMNRSAAEVRLADARRRYGSRHVNSGDAYLCLRDYMAYRALSGQVRFPEAYDHDNYDTVVSELKSRLGPLYLRACMASHQRRYDSAIENFRTLLEMAPLQTDPFNRNLQSHLAYVLKKRAADRKTRRKSPFDK